MAKTSGRRVMRVVFPLAFWLGVWQVAYLAVGQDLLLASPGQVVSYLLREMDAVFFQCVGMTLVRTAAAYGLGIALGGALAVVSHAVPLAGMLIRPALTVVRATPVASFIILALVWLSAGAVPVLAGVLMVTPLVYANVSQGIDAADERLLEMARMFGWRSGKIWRRVLLPSAKGPFLAACEAGVGMCFKATIAAEVIGVPRAAMGTQLYQAKIYLETDGLMAWTVAVIVLSMAAERLLRGAFERRKQRVHHP